MHKIWLPTLLIAGLITSLPLIAPASAATSLSGQSVNAAVSNVRPIDFYWNRRRWRHRAYDRRLRRWRYYN